MRLIHQSLRYQIIGLEHRIQAERIGPLASYAIASWHQNLFSGITSLFGKKICLMVSPSLDGELISWAAKRCNLDTIRGSSSGGGRSAILKMFRYIKQGGKVAITVDGPKGPAHVVKPGILYLAHKTKIPILPMAAVAEKYWTLNKTWDQFRIPKPFTKVRVFFDEPIMIQKKEDIAESNKTLTQALNNLEKKAILI